MLKVIELFSGIGAQRKALENINIPHEIIGVSEIDKYAHKGYEAIFGETVNFGNITKIEKLPYADLWTYSFPCTDISVSGKQLGLNGTRSGLLYEVERLLNVSKENEELPKYLLLENVKNLVGKKFKPDFDNWLEYLDKLGYNTYWQVLNAKDYGIPQNRERVFALSIRKNIDKGAYKFPDKKELKLRIKDITEKNVDEKYYLPEEVQKRFFKKYRNQEISNTIRCGGRGSLDRHCWDLVKVGNCSQCDKSQAGSVYHEDGISPTLCAGTHGYAMGNILQIGEVDIKGLDCIKRAYNTDGISPTLTTMEGGNRQPKILEENTIIDDTQGFDGIRYYDDYCPTLRANRNGLKITESIIAASRGRNLDNPSIRVAGAPTEQRLEFNKNGTSNTLTTVQKDNYLVEPEFRIRKLTPLEYWRLMGFNDDDFHKAKNTGLSDTQLYKQAGNSIVVQVLEGVFRQLFIEGETMDIDFDTNPITEEEVIAVLGKNYKVQGQELVWKCPACPGGDKHGDNMKFNRVKHVLNCFACDFAEEIVGIIARRRLGQKMPEHQEFARRETIAQIEQVEKEKEIAQEALSDYYFRCHYNLMRNKDLLKKMYLKHGILPLTACNCFIGYDSKKNMLVFPSRAIGKDPTDKMLITDNGAEYREIEGEKIIRRISGYEPKICSVLHGDFIMRGIICEGYKDAYNLIQIMKITEPEILSHTAIFTVQNGTNSINTNNCLQKVNWYRFETIGIIMDNDKAGDTATVIATELFPCIKDMRNEYINGYNDIQERFEKEFGEQVDINKALSAKWLDEYEEIK